MKEKRYTCIICPSGCEITAVLDGEKIVSITGNTCKRGEAYVKNELTCPMRTLTTTVRGFSGRPVAVRTADAIPKAKLFEAMAEVNAFRPARPVRFGETLIADLAATGVPLIATANEEA